MATPGDIINNSAKCIAQLNQALVLINDVNSIVRIKIQIDAKVGAKGTAQITLNHQDIDLDMFIPAIKNMIEEHRENIEIASSEAVNGVYRLVAY